MDEISSLIHQLPVLFKLDLLCLINYAINEYDKDSVPFEDFTLRVDTDSDPENEETPPVISDGEEQRKTPSQEVISTVRPSLGRVRSSPKLQCCGDYVQAQVQRRRSHSTESNPYDIRKLIKEGIKPIDVLQRLLILQLDKMEKSKPENSADLQQNNIEENKITTTSEQNKSISLEKRITLLLQNKIEKAANAENVMPNLELEKTANLENVMPNLERFDDNESGNHATTSNYAQKQQPNEKKKKKERKSPMRNSNR